MSSHNGTMKRQVAEKYAQSQLDEAVKSQRGIFLSKVGTSIAMHLDILLSSEHDKLSVLVGLLTNMVARGGGKWEEFEPILRENFEQQRLAHERQATAQTPPVPPTVIDAP